MQELAAARYGVPVSEPLARVEVDERGGDRIARIVGEMDMSNAGEIESALESALTGAGPARRIVDLRATTYLSSAGVRVLFTLAATLNARGQKLFVVVEPDGVVARVVELTDLTRVAPVYARPEDVPTD